MGTLKFGHHSTLLDICRKKGAILDQFWTDLIQKDGHPKNRPPLDSVGHLWKKNSAMWPLCNECWTWRKVKKKRSKTRLFFWPWKQKVIISEEDFYDLVMIEPFSFLGLLPLTEPYADWDLLTTFLESISNWIFNKENLITNKTWLTV